MGNVWYAQDAAVSEIVYITVDRKLTFRILKKRRQDNRIEQE